MKGFGSAALALLALLPVAPAAAQIMVVGSSVQERRAEPGESYVGQIHLRNQGGEPTAVRVYQTDYLFYADGSNLFPAPATEARSNAGWTTVNPTSLVIPAGGEMDVTYQVTVPMDSALSGTHWALIMIEPTRMDEERSSRDPGVGLRAKMRFGVQVATHVGNSQLHGLRIDQPRMTVASVGERAFEFQIVNDGQVGYRPKVSIEVFDPTGARAASVEVERGLIYPGTSALQRVPLGDLAPGLYEIMVAIDTGGTDVFGGQFKLTIGPRS